MQGHLRLRHLEGQRRSTTLDQQQNCISNTTNESFASIFNPGVANKQEMVFKNSTLCIWERLLYFNRR